MSLILGIYSLNSQPSFTDEFSEVIDEFSLHGKRNIKNYYSGNLFLASYQPFPVSYEAINQFDNGIVIALSGRLYGIEDHDNGITSDLDSLLFYENPSNYIKNLYLTKNLQKLRNIDGSFAFSLHDRKNERLILANDSFGQYPLFYISDSDYIIFCNEYEPLTKLNGRILNIDNNALAEYFVFDGVLWNKTLYSDIKPVTPGTILSFFGSNPKKTLYDRLAVTVNNEISPEKATEELSVIIRKAVSKRINPPFENIRIDLSGGLDTRLILSCLTHDERSKIGFQSFITPPLNENNDQDVMISKLIAEKLKLKLSISSFNDWDNEFSPAFYQQWRERSYPEITIKGLYGGEFLNGDCFRFIPSETIQFIQGARFPQTFFSNRLNRPSASLEKAGTVIPRKLFSENMFETCVNPYHTLYRLLSEYHTENKSLLYAYFLFSQSFFTRLYGGTSGLWAQPYTFLTKVDTPFLDHALLRYLLSLPPAFLSGNSDHLLYQLLFKNHFSELNDIPTISSLSEAGGSCIGRFTQGIEPKGCRQFRYGQALLKVAEDKPFWFKTFFDKDAINETLKNPDSKETQSIIDLLALLEH